jgi:hypothetical protein
MAYGDILQPQVKRPVPVPPPSLGTGVGAATTAPRMSKSDIADFNTAGTAKDATLLPTKPAAVPSPAGTGIAPQAAATPVVTQPSEAPKTALDVARPAPTGAIPTAGFNPTGFSLPSIGSPSANEIGKSVRGAVGSVVTPVASAVKTAAGAVGDVASDIGTGTTNFARGLAGADELPKPIATAAPAATGATPTTTPAAAATPATSPGAAIPGPGGGATATKPGFTTGADGSIQFDNNSVSDANKVALAARNTIDANSFAHPGAGVAASSVGGTVPGFSPDNITRPVPSVINPAASRDAVAAAQKGADSDIASILNKDPRSQLGIAARNAQIDLGGIKSPRSRSGVSQQSPYQEALGSLIQRAAQPVANAQQLAVADTTEAGQIQRAQAEAGIKRPEPRPITLADGTTAQIGADGVARPVLDAAGKPVKELQTKSEADQKRDDEQNAAVSKTAGDLFTQSSLTGKPLTIEQAREQARQLHGVPSPAQTGAPDKATYIKTLRANGSKLSDEQLGQAFQERYGS